MTYGGRWETLAEIGAGGQGRVYTVYDRNQFDIAKLGLELRNAIGNLPFATFQEYGERLEEFHKVVRAIMAMDDPRNWGALKVLHRPEDARDPERAEERIKREIQAMSEDTHPNLVRLLDFDHGSKWYVSKYYRNGSLARNPSLFKGNILGALHAFRPLVDAVGELHKRNRYHRDIKPENVYIDDDGSLILGDFGLIFVEDGEGSRLSGTLENVGSRDWMPPWAQGMRVEVRPSFDIFSLGKLLWSMIAGQRFLRLWYFQDPEFDLERLFPNSRYMPQVNKLLGECIVERERSCLANAKVLLARIEAIIDLIERDGDAFKQDIERRCRVCGIGKYRLVADRDSNEARTFGIQKVGDRSFKIFACSHCGHIQFFAFGRGFSSDAWD
jgi:serine/threonine protein kinase